MAVLDRLKKAWNAFRAQGDISSRSYDLGSSVIGGNSSRIRFPTNERTLLNSIYTRIAVDVAGLSMRHVQVDKNDTYVDVIDSKFNFCLNFEPNLDQGARHFRQDIVSTLLEKRVAAIVAVDTIGSPSDTENYEIVTLRVGEITQWFPQHVRVNLYNEATGNKEEIILEKRHVAIVENPLGDVMNGPNSTLQRLVKKLSLLDNVDETSAGRLDMIIQLPYVVKTETRKQQAEQRRKEIEVQLKDSQYGVAYTDGAEKITQLNRPVENQLLQQVEYLTNQLFDQLGITAAVMNGTADEAAMLTYKDRTIKPLADAIKEAMARAFLGRNRIINGERVMYFDDPFKLVPLKDVAEVADVFSRNEILSPNEIRGYMGIIPSADPKADQMINSNNVTYTSSEVNGVVEEDDDFVNSTLDELDLAIDETFKGLEVE